MKSRINAGVTQKHKQIQKPFCCARKWRYELSFRHHSVSCWACAFLWMHQSYIVCFVFCFERKSYFDFDLYKRCFNLSHSCYNPWSRTVIRNFIRNELKRIKYEMRLKHTEDREKNQLNKDQHVRDLYSMEISTWIWYNCCWPTNAFDDWIFVALSSILTNWYICTQTACIETPHESTTTTTGRQKQRKKKKPTTKFSNVAILSFTIRQIFRSHRKWHSSVVCLCIYRWQNKCICLLCVCVCSFTMIILYLRMRTICKRMRCQQKSLNLICWITCIEIGRNISDLT